MDKTLWKKISRDMNRYVRDICNTELGKENKDLLNDYLEHNLGEKEPFKYYDCENEIYIDVDNEIIEQIQKSFSRRVSIKKCKYRKENL